MKLLQKSLLLLSLFKSTTDHPLNRNRKLWAIAHFVKWQIGSRLVPGEVIYEWINGSKFRVRNGETGLTGNIYTGLCEFADMGFLLHVLRGEDLFVDVGANVGSYTMLACSARGARGYAFEPVPETYKRLIENIRLNHLENRVKCFNIGIGRENGVLKFTSAGDTVNHALADGENDSGAISVAVSTLDELLKNEFPSLIKIDVEGYETPVLEGASETLGKQTLHSVIIELNESGNRYNYDESRILDMMFDYGFKTYSYNPFKRVLTQLDGKNKAVGNTLFIRDKDAVMERLISAPMISVHGRQF